MRFFVLLLSVFLLIASPVSKRAFAQNISKFAFGWDNNRQGRFLTALLQDSRGDLWVSTEDKGVWRYDAGASNWVNYNGAPSINDDTAYALAEDGKGRIWVGTLRNGVSVWNGKGWKNYGILDGPLGERVFALVTNPIDGDVWIATSGGVSRYRVKTDVWQHFTRANGLPEDQIQAIAFDRLGNCYLGTQCHGIAIGKAEGDYSNWIHTEGTSRLPLSPTGKGLPASQINDLLVTDDDTIYAATSTGLAQSQNYGEDWTFLRGGDWKEKMDGLYRKPDEKPDSTPLKRELMDEDYVTCLAEDSRGLLWTGYRTEGFQIRRPLPDYVLLSAKNEKDGNFSYVSALLPLADGSFLVAYYGEGLQVGPPVPNFAPTTDEKQAIESRIGWKAPEKSRSLQGVNLPQSDKALSLQQLQTLTEKLRAQTAPAKPGDAVFLAEDWRTRGDWVGRYGRHKAVLCAVKAPFDDIFVRGAPIPRVIPQIGPHYKEPDSIRRWIHWVESKDNRVLFNPYLDARRQAEWDDHGETYPLEFEGPDLWVSIEVAEGTWRLSSYFFNKDGHDGFNRARDYLLEIRRETGNIPPWPSAPEGVITSKILSETFDKYYDEREIFIAKAWQEKPLAKARVRDFWGGVHKQFLLTGPATYWLRVARNYSYNTIVSSVMLDRVGPEDTWYDDPTTHWTNGSFNPPNPHRPKPIDPFLLDKILSGQYRGPAIETPEIKHQAEIVSAAQQLWNTATVSHQTQAASSSWFARLMAYRAASQNNAPADLLEDWRWKMPIWTNTDRAKWKVQIEAPTPQ